ncbi:UNVERIFIED_CONTAM: hypothetical protein PYX00_009745 [Menopon gallinae]|uniref:START domain-containing protein 10 n=1 Tax=Menopon gallinae TaxID=328185 RepID=A0AAW2HCZ8_9NEOP
MSTSFPYFLARISEDSDFRKLKDMATNHEGWSVDYDRATVKVWSKQTDESSFNMVKVWVCFANVNCLDLYDTIHDPEYRKQWDPHMLYGTEIGYLNPNNDICYYSMYCPAPLRNRDFVLQRSWLDAGTEFYILNHSVYHKDYPPKKGFIRAISYFTGYFIKCNTVSRNAYGCELHYVTRCNPQGDLPPWIVNKCTQILAPKYVRQIEKAARGYAAWKEHHNPNFKPWIHPEQKTATKISVTDCVPTREDLDSNPALRKVNFEMYYALMKREPKSNEQLGKKGYKDHSSRPSRAESEKSKTGRTSSEARAGKSAEQSESSPSLKRNKKKNRFNSLLNCTICRKGS